MNLKICTFLIVLPIFLSNAASYASNGSIRKVSVPNTLFATSVNVKPHIVPFQLSARDDQTEDCFRAGKCR